VPINSIYNRGQIPSGLAQQSSG